MPFVRLADNDVRRRQVEQDRSAGKRSHGPRRIGRPEILADFYSEGETGQIACCENQVGAERHFLPAAANGQTDAVAAMGKPALLVIFAVIGQIALGDDAQQFAPRNDQRTVVDASTAPQGGAEHQHGCKIPRCLDDRGDLRLDRVEQGHLQMQIVDGIGRKREFGIEQHVDMLRVGLAGSLQNASRIIRDIRRAHLGRAGRHADKTMRVKIVEGMRVAATHAGWAFRVGISRCGCRFEPVRWLANAQLGQAFLDRAAGNLALGFPAVDGAAGPRIGKAIARAELVRAQGRVMRFAPAAQLETSQVHSRAVSF